MKNLRAAFIAVFVTLGLAPVIAAPPPPVPSLPDASRVTTYTPTASTGPFSVGFAIYGDGTDFGNWLEVRHNGVRLVPGTDWTLSSATGPLNIIPRPITDGAVTLTVARTGKIEIIGARRPRRVSQFSEQRGVTARDLNQSLSDITAQNREMWDRQAASITSQPGVVLGPLPSPADCAGKYLIFDATGLNPSCVADANVGPFLGGNIPANSVVIGSGTQILTSVAPSSQALAFVSTGANSPPAFGLLGSSGLNFIQSGTGSISRTFDQLYRDGGRYAYPEMYGAACGTGTDSTLGIQRAIDYLRSTFGGGTVELANCIYRTGPITLTSGIRIRGKSHALAASGSSEINFVPTGINQAAIEVIASGGSGIASSVGLENFKLTGAANTTTYKTGIRITDGSFVTMRDLNVISFNGGVSASITGMAASPSGEIRVTLSGAAANFNDGWAVAVDGVVGPNVGGSTDSTGANASWPIVIVSGTEIDLKGSTYTNARVSGGTITASSTAIQTKGRELIVAENVTMLGDLGLRVSKNPNQAVNALDQSHFFNSTIVSSGTNCNVMIDDGVTMTSVAWGGYQSWGGGRDGWCWRDRSSIAINGQITLANIRSEQKSVAGGALFVLRPLNTTYSVAIENPFFSDRRGVVARNIANLQINNAQGLGTQNYLDIDSSVQNTKITNSYWIAGSSATITGQTLLQGSGFNAGGLPSNATYANVDSTTQFSTAKFNGTTTMIGGATIGATGSVNGSFGFYGLTSGLATFLANPVQGNPTISIPTTSGTLVTNAVSPLLINATSGQISCPSCNTSAATLNAGTTNQLAYYSGPNAISGLTTLLAAQFPALTGDITTTSGSLATALATVNSNVGSFGGASSVPNFTVNSKGLVTAAGATAVVAPAGTLSGTTLASGVTASSLTSFGTSPVANTAAVDTSTTQIATTAFVIGQAGTATPLVDGTGAAGTSKRYAPIDHVHPTDTSRAPLASPTFTGVPAAPTAAPGTNTTQIANTAFVTAAVTAATTGVASVNTRTGAVIVYNKQATATFVTDATSSTSTVYQFKLTAGGGGGGGSNGTTATASGGGGGGTCSGTFTGVAAGATVTVTIGAAGIGGANTGGNGTAGGNSTIAATGITTITATGGGLANGTTGTTSGFGSGGSCTTGTGVTSLAGAHGMYGTSTAAPASILSGQGGGSFWGAGGGSTNPSQNSNGGSARSCGGGGGGAAYTTGTGGDGFAGCAEINWISVQ